MKTLALIDSLTTGERKTFESVIKTHKRQSLQKLFRHLCKLKRGKASPDKARMFAAAFDTAYSQAKDYLLRNELRLLNDRLQAFLVNREFEHACGENRHLFKLWLLKAQRRRKLKQQFELSYRSAYRAACEDQQDELATEMLELQLYELVNEREITDEGYARVVDLTNKQLRHIKRAFIQGLRPKELRRAWVVDTLRYFDSQEPAPAPAESLDLLSPDLNNPYTLSTYYNALSYRHEDMQRVAVCEKALEHLMQCKDKNNNMRKLVLFTNMALECRRLNKIDDAARYYAKLLQTSQRYREPLQASAVYNYFSFLIFQDKYRDAIRFYHEQPKEMQDNPRIGHKLRCKMGMCHILLNDPDTALEFLETSLRERPARVQFYFRFIPICALFLRGDAESALRECGNLIGSIRYKDQRATMEEFYLALLRQYSSYFEAVLGPPGDCPQRCGRIAAKLTQFHADYGPEYKDDLPLLWLSRQCEERSTQGEKHQ